MRVALEVEVEATEEVAVAVDMEETPTTEVVVSFTLCRCLPYEDADAKTEVIGGYNGGGGGSYGGGGKLTTPRASVSTFEAFMS